MTSSKTFVKNLCMYWFPKAIVLFFQCCNMAHYKCNSSPAWWRSFSIPKVPPQWGCKSCFLKVPTQQVWYHEKKKKNNKISCMVRPLWEGVTSGRVALSSISCSPLILVMPSPQIGPYVPCKRHCLGGYVNQHSPVHQPFETQYEEPNFFGAKFQEIVTQVQIPHHKIPFFFTIICPIKIISGMNHQNSISG